VSGFLGTSRGSSRRSSSTTPPRAGLSSTTSPPPHVRVPQHFARLVTPLVVLLVVDYSASRRLVVDYFASVARPGASARRAARHAARRAARRRLLRLAQARRRLLRLRRASGCLGTSSDSSRGSSRHSSSTSPPRAGSSSTTPPLVVDYSTSRRLVVDYFTSAVRLCASARRVACHAARRATLRRLLRLVQARHRVLRLVQARRRLLGLHRVSVCLGTSRGLPRGSSRRSSSTTPPRAGSSLTTSPPSRVRVPRHVVRLVTRLVAPLVVDYSASRRLVIDYFTFVVHPGASTRRAAHLLSSTTSPMPHVWVPRHVARLIACRRLLRLRLATGCIGTSHGSSRGSLRRSSSTTSPTPRVRVPRHVARPVTRLIVDYSVCRDFVLRPR
jgi:hypothetical protein